MLNRICATALFYYSSDNTTAPRLDFYQHVVTGIDHVNYEQDPREFLRVVYGIYDKSPGAQYVGNVVCKEGRLLTFPNILLHRIGPCKLIDPTIPGHRKVLVLFLVDPNIRIISTADVPPQQRDWWGEKVWADGGFGGLSRELHDQVVDEVEEFPISVDEAKSVRLQLINERKAFAINQYKMFTG
jgi:hypothetical protein